MVKQAIEWQKQKRTPNLRLEFIYIYFSHILNMWKSIRCIYAIIRLYSIECCSMYNVHLGKCYFSLSFSLSLSPLCHFCFTPESELTRINSRMACYKPYIHSVEWICMQNNQRFSMYFSTNPHFSPLPDDVFFFFISLLFHCQFSARQYKVCMQIGIAKDVDANKTKDKQNPHCSMKEWMNKMFSKRIYRNKRGKKHVNVCECLSVCDGRSVAFRKLVKIIRQTFQLFMSIQPCRARLSF